MTMLAQFLCTSKAAPVLGAAHRDRLCTGITATIPLVMEHAVNDAEQMISRYKSAREAVLRCNAGDC